MYYPGLKQTIQQQCNTQNQIIKCCKFKMLLQKQRLKNLNFSYLWEQFNILHMNLSFAIIIGIFFISIR